VKKAARFGVPLSFSPPLLNTSFLLFYVYFSYLFFDAHLRLQPFPKKG